MAAKRADPKETSRYKVTITLNDSDPPIWRRLEVPECTLAVLDLLIKAAMGWDGSHLSDFRKGRQIFGDPFDLTGGMPGAPKVRDWLAVELKTLMPARAKSSELRYTYDFGDLWRHRVVLERAEGAGGPVCTGGARACPPDDVGGMHGYEEFLEILAGPQNERRELVARWLGENYDPEAFSLEEVNQRLQACWPGG